MIALLPVHDSAKLITSAARECELDIAIPLALHTRQ